MAGRHVALIRGINVGRAKRVAMADLRELLARLGYGENLKEIEVVFVVDKTETGTLTSTRSFDALVRYEFPVGELQR